MKVIVGDEYFNNVLLCLLEDGREKRRERGVLMMMMRKNNVMMRMMRKNNVMMRNDEKE